MRRAPLRSVARPSSVRCGGLVGLVLLLPLLASGVAARQDARAQAAALFAAGDHAGAAALYEQLLEADDPDGASWYRYGYSLHALGRLDEAVVAHERAARDGTAPHAVNAAYNLACALALLGRGDEAFAALNDALARGFANPALLEQDGDLASLRDDPRWAALRRRATAGEPTPVEEVAARRRQFDFWLGDWDVVARGPGPDKRWYDFGQLAIRVVPVLDGGAILEFATGTLEGFSLRVFDPERDAWRLLLNWPSNGSASFSTLEGRFRHGRGTFYTAPWPAPQRTRYTFSDIGPDRLRWDGASTSDGDVSWATNLILESTRRPASAPPLDHGPAWRLAPEQGGGADGGPYAAPVGQSLGRAWGHWTGTRTPADGGPAWQVSVDCWAILDGAVWLVERRLDRPGAPPRSELLVLGWQTGATRWEAWWLDADLGLSRWLGNPDPADDGLLRVGAADPATARGVGHLELGPAGASRWELSATTADRERLWHEALTREGPARTR